MVPKQVMLVLLMIVATACTQVVAEEPVSFETRSTGSTSMGDVQIDLTPLGNTDSGFEVYLAANTHSVDLSQYDLIEIAQIEHDGEIVSPSEAPALSGHHSRGNLIFPSRVEGSFKIRIMGIPAEPDRVFVWGGEA